MNNYSKLHSGNYIRENEKQFRPEIIRFFPR